MNNFQVTDKDSGKKYWISRSMAVTGLIVNYKHSYKGIVYILANKRGKGTPDFQGYWNLPCGYVDFHETTKEAVSREVWEECGFPTTASQFNLLDINDCPSENNQNITIRYGLKCSTNLDDLQTKGGEINEVEEIKWIRIDQIDQYEWAFNHKAVIQQYVKDSWFKKLLRKLYGE